VRIKKLDDGSYIVDAKTDLEEFRNQTGLSLAIDEAEEGADTLGGLVVWLLGRVPPRGEIVTHPAGFEFEVLEADPRRVKRVRIRPPARPAAAADETVD
jgi:magnesium and cobalt transporter